MATLQPARHLVASLISSLPSAQDNATSNPLRDASQETQNALLALHVLFPNELLPALDLLDRGLVTRFTVTDHAKESPERRLAAVHYVRSAQQASHRHQTAPTSSYEVRVESWSCSCPAFAFAAFPAEADAAAVTSPPDISAEEHAECRRGGADRSFGGLTRGTDLPVCKHLLACVLVEHSEMFRSFSEERQVSVEELAGWAAGWGD